MDQEAPSVSVVIPVYNGVDLLARCLASLHRQTGVACEVIVVDDASPEDPTAVVSQHPGTRLLRQGRNTGYAAANNAGLSIASGEFLLFLNSDTQLPPGSLGALVAYLQAHPDAAGVAPLHRDPAGSVQQTCFGFPTLCTGLLWDSAVHHRFPHLRVFRDYLMSDWDHRSERWVDHAQTSCLLIRRLVYETIGGMDEHLELFYNDTDYCLRMSRAGYRIRFVPSIEILHHGGTSVASLPDPDARVYRDRYRYYRKWFGWPGGLAVRLALWSRVHSQSLTDLFRGRPRSALARVHMGLQFDRALGRSRPEQ